MSYVHRLCHRGHPLFFGGDDVVKVKVGTGSVIPSVLYTTYAPSSTRPALVLGLVLSRGPPGPARSSDRAWIQHLIFISVPPSNVSWQGLDALPLPSRSNARRSVLVLSLRLLQPRDSHSITPAPFKREAALLDASLRVHSRRRSLFSLQMLARWENGQPSIIIDRSIPDSKRLGLGLTNGLNNNNVLQVSSFFKYRQTDNWTNDVASNLVTSYDDRSFQLHHSSDMHVAGTTWAAMSNLIVLFCLPNIWEKMIRYWCQNVRHSDNLKRCKSL